MAAQLTSTNGPLARGPASLKDVGDQALTGASFTVDQDGRRAPGGTGGLEDLADVPA